MEQGRIVILMGAHLKSKVNTSLFIRNTDRTKKTMRITTRKHQNIKKLSDSETTFNKTVPLGWHI